MAKWDIVTSEFNGEETFNFGPREESGLALFDVQTVATISANGTVGHQPTIHGSICKTLAIISVDDHASFFRNGCHDFISVLSFETNLETCAWTKDQNFIALAEQSGKIRILHILSRKEIFCQKLDSEITGNNMFSSSVFTDIDENGFCHFLILTISGKLYFISNINVNKISECLSVGQFEELKELTLNLNLMSLQLNDYHRELTCLCPVAEDLIYVSGSGPNFLTEIVFDGVSNFWTVNDNLPIMNIEMSVVKDMIFIKERETILILDEQGYIFEFDVLCFIITKCWRGLNVKQMHLLDNVYKSNDFYICFIQMENDNAYLKITNIDDFYDPNYSLKVQWPSYLLKPTLLHDQSIFFIESEREEKCRFFNTIRIRSLTESKPEDKRNWYLSKKRFEEAENITKQYDLDMTMVYEVHCIDLIDKLSPWNVLTNDEMEHYFILLMEKLEFVNSEDVILTYSDASLPTFNYMSSFLNLLEKKLKKMSSKNYESISYTLSRLTTYQFCFSKYNANEWNNFKNANVYYEFIKFIKNGELSKAFIIWNRYEREMNDKMPHDGIKTLLTYFPKGIQILAISSWLSQHFIPFIIFNRPCDIPHVSSFIYEKSFELEKNDFKNWPDNSIEACNILLSLLPKYTNIYSTILTACELTTYDDFPEDPLMKLKHLCIRLENIKELKEVYNCSLTYQEFLQESVKSILFRIINNFQTLNFIHDFINNTVEKYVKKYSLNLEEIFIEYIESQDRKTYNYWESKCIEIVKFIQSVHGKIKAVIALVHLAEKPWSLELSNLVHSTLHFVHPQISLLRDECEIADLRLVLKKYGFLQDPTSYNAAMIRRMIAKMFSTALKSALQDALKLVKRYKIVDEDYVYEMYIYSLLNDYLQLDNYLNLVINSNNELSIHAILIGINFCEEKMLYQSDAHFQNIRNTVCSAVNNILMRKINAEDRHNLEAFIIKLTAANAIYRQFNETPMLSDLSSETQRMEYVCNMVSCDNFEINWYLIKRFANNLTILNNEKLYSEIISQCITNGNILQAIALCNSILDNEPSPIAADSLIEVPRIVISYLNSNKELINNYWNIVNLLKDILCRMTKLCSSHVMEFILKISKLITLAASIASNCVNANTTLTEDDLSKNQYSIPTYKLNFEIIMPTVYEFLYAYFLSDDTTILSTSMKILIVLSENKHFWLVLEFTDYLWANRETLLHNNKPAISKLKNFTAANSIALFSNIMNTESIDTKAGLCLLKKRSLTSLESVVGNILIGGDKNYNLIIQVCGMLKILLDYVQLNEDDKKTRLNKIIDLEKNGHWGLKLSEININFKDYCYKVDAAKAALLPTIIENENCDVNLIIDYCRDFNLNTQHFIMVYFQHFLLNVQWTLINPKDVFDTVLHVVSSSTVYHKVETVFKQIDPYDYEKLAYILKFLNRVNTNETYKINENYKNYLVLLNYLRDYERISETNDLEDFGIDSVNIRNNSLLNSNSKKIPFHSLLSPETQSSIINKELYFSSLEFWLKTSTILTKLKPDVLKLRAISNEFEKYRIKSTQNLLWEKEDRLINDSFFSSLCETILKFDDFEKSCGMLNHLLKKIQHGSERLEILRIALKLVEIFAEKGRSEKNVNFINDVQKIYKKYKTCWKDYSTLQILHDNQLISLLVELGGGDGRNFQPLELLLKLYELPASLKKTNVLLNINTAAKDISKIHKFDLKKFKSHLLMKWLSTKKHNEFDINYTLRISFLVKDDNFQDNIEELLRISFKDDSYDYAIKFRAINCLYVLLGQNELTKRCGLTEEKLLCFTNQFYYLQQLDGFHLTHSVQSFQATDKDVLAMSLLKSRCTDSKALKFICEFCLNHSIFRADLWKIAIDQVRKYCDNSYFYEILNRLKNIPGLEFLKDSDIFDSILKPLTTCIWPLNEDDLEKCLESLQMFYGNVVEMNEIFCNRLCLILFNLKLYWCAIYTFRLSPKSNESLLFDILEKIFNLTTINELLLDFEKCEKLLKKRKWIMFQRSILTDIIYNYVDNKQLYDQVLDSSVIDEFVLFLCKNNRIVNFTAFATLSCRIKDSIRLCNLLANYYPEELNKDLEDEEMLKVFLIKNNCLEAANKIKLNNDCPYSEPMENSPLQASCDKNNMNNTDKTINESENSIIIQSPKLATIYSNLSMEENDFIEDDSLCEYD